MRNIYENIKIIKRLVKNSYDNYTNFEKIFDDQIKVIKLNKDFGKVPPPPPSPVRSITDHHSAYIMVLKYI